MYQDSGQNLFLCHGTENFNCTHFKLIISDHALITLELFLLRYVRFNWQKFSGLPEKLSLNPTEAYMRHHLLLKSVRKRLFSGENVRNKWI